jgi:hypothetical protein
MPDCVRLTATKPCIVSLDGSRRWSNESMFANQALLDSLVFANAFD